MKFNFNIDAHNKGKWKDALLHKKLYHCLYVYVIQTAKLETALSYRDNVCLLLKRYGGKEFYGFLFICNSELKIYKYRAYRLNSAHAVIYLEKINLNKKS